MKGKWKIILGVIIGVMLMGMTVCAEEYSVTDVEAVLWTNASTVVQVDADTKAAVVLPPMEIGTPVHITGVTSNGYWRVEIDGATYYIVGAGLGDTIVTNEYIRKYYDKPVIINQKGVTIEIDYTEWNLVTHSFKVAYTATNNSPYTLDIRAQRAYIYDGYDWEDKQSWLRRAYVDRDYGVNEDVEIIGIAPGTSMSGCKYGHVFDEYLNEDKKISLFTTYFHVSKNKETHGNEVDYIEFEVVKFYDYTTAATRVESPNAIRSKVGFKDVP